MAVAASRDEFLTLVRRSELVAPPNLAAFLRDCPEVPEEPVKLANVLRKAGLLTRFQAEQLLQGRHRGFDVGKYRIMDPIGSGAMGLVYLCEHRDLHHQVAVKILPKKSIHDDPLAIARFKREARAAAGLSHPNIVRTHDIDQVNGYHFLVMEYVQGRTLFDIVTEEGPLALDQAVHCMIQTALGLQHIFESGLVHRDLKPGNLLLDETGTVKIHDLGLALFTDDRRDNLTQNANAGTILGTADFLSPEQAMHSSDVDIRTDIYSLGATLYFLITGEAPFAKLSLTQKLLALHRSEPTPLREFNPSIPEAFEKVLRLIMAKDREERYQTPLEAAHALAPFVTIPIELPALDSAPAPAAKKSKASASAHETNKLQHATKTRHDSSFKRPRPKSRAAVASGVPAGISIPEADPPLGGWLRDRRGAAVGAVAGFVAVLVLSVVVLPRLFAPRVDAGNPPAISPEATAPEASER